MNQFLLQMKKILVTGANSFIGKHIISDLIKRDYKVRATVRDFKQSAIITSDIESYLNKKVDIDFFEANLLDDEGWDPAIKDSEVVVHVASPFPLNPVENEFELIKPAKEGTLRVLQSCLKNNVKRVILTSSNAAVYGGNQHLTHFTEETWTNLDSKNINAYTKSKTIAEMEAWSFVKKHPTIKLTCINPVLVWGVGIGNHLNSSSLTIFKRLMTKEVPILARVKIPIVDVRDVSLAHVTAIEDPKSIGERFLLCSGTFWMKDIAKTMSSSGFNPPIFIAPNFLIKFFGKFDRSAKMMIPFLDYDFNVSSKKLKGLLGMKLTPMEKTIQDTGNYLLSYDKKK